MSKHTVTGYLVMSHDYDWTANRNFEKQWRPRVMHYKGDDAEDRIFIREMPIEVEVPDDFDPIPKQVAAMEAEKRAALAEYQQKVAEINERLSKLQALTFDSEAA